MPKLWLPDKEDAFFGLNTYPVVNHTSKYIWSMDENDIFISPIPIQKALLEYIGKIKGFNHACRVITLEKLATPYSIVESILQNTKQLNQLRQLTQTGDWQLESYIQSKPMVKLSEALDIPINGTAKNLILDGLTETLNCKSDFKNFCSRLGIDTVPGYVAVNLEELHSAIDRVSRENHDKIILKKSKAIGGRGNLIGNKNSLKQNLEQWYRVNEKIVVEHYLNFQKTAGALTHLTNDAVKFLGINQQIIENQRWVGFQYPFNHKLALLIREKTLAFAEFAHQKGGRGFLNIDFGIHHGKLYALECNFRHTGFSFLFKTLLKGHEETRKLLYHDKLPAAAAEDFPSLKNKLQQITCNGQPVLIQKNGSQTQGLIIINMTPDENTYGAAVYGENEDYVKKVFKLISSTETK